MARLGTEIDRVLSGLSADASRLVRINQMRQTFARAVAKIFSGNPDAVRLVLEHINAVYLREDTAPRKGPGKDEPYLVCEIYSDSAMVRSELDNWRQLLTLELLERGFVFEEMRIFPSKMGMKERHPYEKLLELDLENMDWSE